ncbi:glycoside hydrolase family 15 protein (plasmid) [Haloarcula sp. NS06]|uniref:glycoside hydrolase family 15 protein n=1 Tax=Haloarcula sp. NS06 TaxID=3409688 RepID=UPI003DA760EB
MVLRRSLDDYKRNTDATHAFPGERRTQQGRFTGTNQRLVHISPDGTIRDFSHPLCGLHGIASSRFGIRNNEGVHWFDEFEEGDQTYQAEKTAVETIHNLNGFEIRQQDITNGLSHVTSFEVAGGLSSNPEIIGFVEFVPDGQEGQVGQLIHDDEIIEVYHDKEHDYLSASTDLSAITPEVLEGFDEILADKSTSFPRFDESDEYEGSRLTGGVSFCTQLNDGQTTIVNRLTDINYQSRSDSLAAINEWTQRHAGSLDTSEAVSHASRWIVDDELVSVDLRVLDMLSAPTGARIAGPDFDPHYQYSGGYGYMWFRDDGEISTFLLHADKILNLNLDDVHRRSAQFYLQTQLDDGRWPHRVWPRNGRLAPGWANGHIEGDERHYQADQTASALIFLAEYLSYEESIPERFEPELRDALARGVDGLDGSIEADGLPAVCENAWENMNGRFTHTTAKFLHAYSAIADAPFDPGIREHAAEQADMLYEALETMWVPEDRIYALRLQNGNIDARVDSSTFALIDAHLAYDAIDDIDANRRQRLAKHLETGFDRLWTETDNIRGLQRFEADAWRQRTQDSEKVWTVSTGWGAHAAEKAVGLFRDTNGSFDAAAWSDRLFDEITFGGSLCLPSGYLPEQFFDSGTPDSATPLGWSHAIRLATYAARQDR